MLASSRGVVLCLFAEFSLHTPGQWTWFLPSPRAMVLEYRLRNGKTLEEYTERNVPGILDSLEVNIFKS